MEGKSQLSFLERGEPVAVDIWISEPAKKQFGAWLKHSMRGLEFGSGCSTLWLSQRVKSLVSVEHHVGWYERVKGILDCNGVTNVELIYAEPENYTDVLGDYADGWFDFVFNDGLAKLRNKCIEDSWSKIRKGGVMVIDNSESSHSRRGIRLIKDRGAKGVRYHGAVTNPWTGRHNAKGIETSIWTK